MNAKEFLSAMGELDDSYYEQAAACPRKRRKLATFAALAACLVLLVAVSLAALLPGLQEPVVPAEAPVQTAAEAAPALEASEPAEDPASPAPTVSLALNEIQMPTSVTANIDLVGEDYSPMTYEALTDYLGIRLPLSELPAQLVLQGGDYGVFQRDGDVYYDANTLVLENADQTQRLTLTLSKANKHVYDFFDLTAEELQFTTVGGRELAVFHYTNEAGADCFYTEFLQDDVAFLLASENLSAEEYASCLQALVAPAPPQATHTLTGVVSVVDPYANRISIRLPAEDAAPYSRGYGIILPENLQASDYSLGDTIKVTFEGEPATICTIWAEQLLSLEPVS